MINKRKANKNAEKLKPIRIQQKKTNKNAAKKANKNSPGPGTGCAGDMAVYI